MAIQVKVPTILRKHTAGVPVIVAQGATLGAVLHDLEARFPGVTKTLRTPEGGLNRFVNIYVNEDDARHLGALEAKVTDGDTVSIVPAVAGG